jgi:hypothetical protein
MSLSMKLTFSNKNQYGNDVFICKKSNDSDSYATALTIHKKIKRMFSTYLPVYVNEEKEYARVQFRNTYIKFKPKHVYEINFDVKSVNVNDKKHANVVLSSYKLLSSPEDEDEIISFSDML